ncbi:MAG TPA: 3-deoxy-8-phosphooctulonate synthase [Bacteroidota bacterium]|nr:3-deoxy-8-phosphooctulonate synthase [Bacteroidota bacterium]
MTRVIEIGDIRIGGGGKLVLFAGPCVVENRDLVLQTAEQIRKTAEAYSTPVVFKSSYKKANRTSGRSFMGIGMDEALKILQEVKQSIGLPILTDIHAEAEAAAAAEVADVLQIPAFLCRQTELLHAAGRTGRVVNIKKGQFLAPEDMKHAAAKVEQVGNTSVLLTERGTTFGYHNLVVDMRSLKIMRDLGYPVVLDATHSVQLPAADTTTEQTAGQPEFILPLARAGVAVGIDGLFVEVHPDPPRALSDAASQLRLDRLEELLRQVTTIDRLVKESAFIS